MSSNSTAFTGASAYSKDFESVIARAVAIRSMGLTALNASKARTIAEAGAVGSLDTAFTNLQNAVAAIQSSTGLSSLSASVSTSGVVQPTLAAGALPATYSIEVTNLGAATNTLSKDALSTVTDPALENIGAGTSFTLTVNGVNTAITPAA